MCLALRHQALEGAYAPDALRAAAEAFLRRNMNAWLTGGHSLRAVLWMKIVHERTGSPARAPLELIRDALHSLPGGATCR